MLPDIESVRRRLIAIVQALPTEQVGLDQACGRVLRQDIRSQQDQPAFARSAMDGYAVATSTERRWKIVREIPAGAPSGLPLAPGECAKIMTGAAVPAGSTRVLPQEWTRCVESSVKWISGEGPDYIRQQGEDCKKGNILLQAGKRLGATEIALLAQQGIADPEVGRHPSVLHLATGDELVAAGEKLHGNCIHDSNSPLIAALLQSMGLPKPHSARVGDRLPDAQQALEQLDWKNSDALLISGGAGRGGHDIALPLLQSLGFEAIVLGVDLRPGKPFTAAQRGKQLAFILPGNPVSHWVVWHIFVRPCLERLQGLNPEVHLLTLPLSEDWPCGGDERELRWPARVEISKCAQAVRPLALSSSGDISRLAGANALIYHNPAGAVLSKGKKVQVELV